MRAKPSVFHSRSIAGPSLTTTSRIMTGRWTPWTSTYMSEVPQRGLGSQVKLRGKLREGISEQQTCFIKARRPAWLRTAMGCKQYPGRSHDEKVSDRKSVVQGKSVD